METELVGGRWEVMSLESVRLDGEFSDRILETSEQGLVEGKSTMFLKPLRTIKHPFEEIGYECCRI